MFRICTSIRFQLPWVNTKPWKCYIDACNIMLIFIKTDKLSSKMVVPICITISSLWKLLLYHNLQAFDTASVLDFDIVSVLYNQIGLCWYFILSICILLMTYDAEHLSCLFVTCTSSLMRYFLRSLVHFWSGCLIPYCWVLRIFCVSWITILYQICRMQIFSPSLWLVSYSLDIIFCRAEVFSFNKVQLDN